MALPFSSDPLLADRPIAEKRQQQPKHREYHIYLDLPMWWKIFYGLWYLRIAKNCRWIQFGSSPANFVRDNFYVDDDFISLGTEDKVIHFAGLLGKGDVYMQKMVLFLYRRKFGNLINIFI